MKSEFFLENYSNPPVLIPQIYKEWKTYYEWEAFKQYDPTWHKINDKVLRPDKEIQIPDPDDSTKTLKKWVWKNRLAVPLQQSITLNKTAFTTGGKVKYKSRPETKSEKATYAKVMETINREKMDPFKNSEIVKAFLSQTESAEIWYSKKDPKAPKDLSKVRLKCNVYTPAEGNQLIPVFDEHHDLIAFGLGYKRKESKAEIDCMDLYDDKNLTRFEKTAKGQWTQIEQIEHLYGKIPVIYYSIRYSCWKIVQPLIERIEFLLSNHADTNDYNGSPILLAKGTVKGFSAKGESGKVIEAEGPDADLKYIESANTPESIKMEWDNLWEIVHSMTNTANLSMEKMASLTTASGAAIERMLMNAHLGAMDLHNGVYGIGVQRRLNFLVTACANIYTECQGGDTLDITPEFGLFRLDNTREQVEVAKLAKEAGLADDATLIAYAGLTDDPEATLKLIRESSIQANNV